jgi:hypothetical protein
LGAGSAARPSEIAEPLNAAYYEARADFFQDLTQLAGGSMALIDLKADGGLKIDRLIKPAAAH